MQRKTKFVFLLARCSAINRKAADALCQLVMKLKSTLNNDTLHYNHVIQVEVEIC